MKKPTGHEPIAGMILETYSIFRMKDESKIHVVVVAHSYKVLVSPREEWKEHTETKIQGGWITCDVMAAGSRKSHCLGTMYFRCEYICV